jgi:predicted regulator of Ras-like GTPase activity (Roadblock/LC7/MglB family)
MNIEKIREIFTEIKGKNDGIKDILLVTEDGFPIVTTLETGDEEARSTAVGAIICEAGQRGIQELELGHIDVSVIIGTKGYFIMKRLQQDSIIMVVVDDRGTAAPLGLSLLRIKNAVPRIKSAYETDASY